MKEYEVTYNIPGGMKNVVYAFKAENMATAKKFVKWKFSENIKNIRIKEYKNITGMAKQTFMARVKAYRKLHPRCSQVEAMKKLKGTTVSGTKKKRKATVMRKIAGVAKKPVTVKKTVTVSRKAGAIGSVKRGEKLIREIDRLEKKRKGIKNKELRDIVQLEINARHDQLKQIKRSFKRAS